MAYLLSAFGDFMLSKKGVRKSTISFRNKYINTSTIYYFARGNRSLPYSQAPRTGIGVY